MRGGGGRTVGLGPDAWGAVLALVVALGAGRARSRRRRPGPGPSRGRPGPTAGPDDRPEAGTQAAVPLLDQASGRSRDGYWCNLRWVGGSRLGGGRRRHADELVRHLCLPGGVGRPAPRPTAWR